MPLETASYISDLVTTNPDGSDQRSTADDHLRLIKKAITQTFPNIAGQVSVSHAELNRLDGISANIETRLDAHLASIGAINTTISAMSTRLDNFSQTFSVLNATVQSHGSGITQHDRSISALNTTISGITTTLDAHAASLSELSTNVLRANPGAFNQTLYYAMFSTSLLNTNLNFGPSGWSATVSSAAGNGRKGFVVTHGLNFDLTASGIWMGAYWMDGTGREMFIDTILVRDANSIFLDTSNSSWTSTKLKLSFLRK